MSAEAHGGDAIGEGAASHDATADAMSGQDVTISDAPAEEHEASPTPDTGMEETGGDSAGNDGSGPPDAPADVQEAGAPESGMEAGAEGGADGGTDGPEESGKDAPADVAPEAPHDAGPTLSPCTTVGQTGCVQCQHNAAGNGVCTPTEAAIVQHDIDVGLATAPGPDPADGCYACLNSKIALDDDRGSTGNECEDSLTTGTDAECLAVLSCILQSGDGDAGSSCAAAVVNACYCGPAAPGSACNSAGSAVNGPCVNQIATGFGFPVSDNHDILHNFSDQTFASGIVTTMFQAAVTNKCGGCQN
jgi:hypothetical protein